MQTSDEREIAGVEDTRGVDCVKVTVGRREHVGGWELGRVSVNGTRVGGAERRSTGVRELYERERGIGRGGGRDERGARA